MDQGWQTDRECWQAGYNLLYGLRSSLSKMMGTTAPEPLSDEAQIAVRDYCRKLRNSDRSLTLPRIQRDFRVPDFGIILILYAAAFSVGMPHLNGSIQEALLFACGFNPSKILALRDLIDSGSGYFKFLSVHQGRLVGSIEFRDLLRGTYISESEIEDFRNAINISSARSGMGWTGDPVKPKEKTDEQDS